MDFKRFFITGDKKVFTMPEIEWWLLKYSDIQKEILAFQESEYIDITLEDGSVVKMPPLEEDIRYKEFLDLYSRLDALSEFHRYENYFEHELEAYYKVKHSLKELKKWETKNEKLATEDFMLFLVDYLDYSPNAKHLNIYFPYSKDLNLYIDEQYFRHTIKFLTIFNFLYWEQEILPESIAKIEVENS